MKMQVGLKLRKCASVPICRVCVPNVELIIIMNEKFFFFFFFIRHKPLAKKNRAWHAVQNSNIHYVHMVTL